jgi:cytochrome c oxidase assembly protein subunit 17
MGQGSSTPQAPVVRIPVLEEDVLSVVSIVRLYLTNDPRNPNANGSHIQEAPKKTQKVGIKTGKPICCCCPDTKLLRDECVVQKGEEHADCVQLIEAHKECLRAEGFDVK